MSQSVAFRYHMHPLDLHTRRWHIKARRKHPQITDWLFHLTTLAQNARAKGRILIGGAPAEAEDIALAWNPNAGDEEVQEWTEVLAALVEAEVLTQEEQGWSITRPSEWYLPPSKLEERNHEEEWEARKARRNATRRKPTEDVPDTARECPDTLGNAREESETLGNAREDSGTPGNARLPNQNQNLNLNPPPTGGSHAGSPSQTGTSPRQVGLGRAVEVLDQHWPQVLAPAEAGRLSRFLAEPGTFDQKLDALQQVCAEVCAELDAGSDIRRPRSVVLTRAASRLAQIRASPHPPPDPWANPPQLPEYVRVAEGETPPERSPVL